MRLNLGSGDFPAAGWVNVDSWAGNLPDVVASLLELPFPDGSAERVYAGHVLEHLDYDTEVPAALAEVWRVLTPGGMAVFVTPDVDRCDDSSLYGATHGAQRWPGDEHKWAATETLLLEAVRRVFPDAQPISPDETARELVDWPVVAHVGWQCTVAATKP